ncbi:hypothetical protein HMPREF3034_01471 [Prevotella sp. DNF00663]|nr:hypothetical protein HMPREF3034_01471 [Prevotella sp. DNF00663]
MSFLVDKFLSHGTEKLYFFRPPLYGEGWGVAPVETKGLPFAFLRVLSYTYVGIIQ